MGQYALVCSNVTRSQFTIKFLATPIVMVCISIGPCVYTYGYAACERLKL